MKIAKAPSASPATIRVFILAQTCFHRDCTAGTIVVGVSVGSARRSGWPLLFRGVGEAPPREVRVGDLPVFRVREDARVDDLLRAAIVLYAVRSSPSCGEWNGGLGLL